jgi:hypothetical protein
VTILPQSSVHAAPRAAVEAITAGSGEGPAEPAYPDGYGSRRLMTARSTYRPRWYRPIVKVVNTQEFWLSPSHERPILILSTGQRCGSTWLQRMLSTNPSVFIWGEHHGVLAPVLEKMDWMVTLGRTSGETARKHFVTHGTRAFISGLTPSETVIRGQVLAMLDGMFRRDTDGQLLPAGTRWGFKEVYYGADFLRRFVQYFPHVRAIQLTRDPVAVLRSLDWWERSTPPADRRPWLAWNRNRTVHTLNTWRDVNRSFLDADDLDDRVLLVHYEKLKDDPGIEFARICEFLDLDPADLDLSHVDDVIHSAAPFGRVNRQLRDRAEILEAFAELLAEPGLVEVAGRLGYELAAVPAGS